MAAKDDTGPARDTGRDVGVVALAGTVERLNRRVGGVEEVLAELSEQVGELDAPGGPRARPFSWLAPREVAQAEAILTELTAWLEAVYLRYADADLPACWLWHPDVVEELVWLRAAHAAAYSGKDAHINRVADWHDRHRPGVARRVHRAAGSCDLSEHQPGGSHHRPARRAPCTAAIPALAVWTANGATDTPPTPAPDLVVVTQAS